LTRGTTLEVIHKGGERRRNRWSRGMTKKELSDMALGVRELSRRLGSARMKLRVSTILIVTKKHDTNLVGVTRQVTEWLLERTHYKMEPYTV
jgi:NAD+ kinase